MTRRVSALAALRHLPSLSNDGNMARVRAECAEHLRDGERLVAAHDSAQTPCRCVTGVYAGVQVTQVAWSRADGRWHLRCLACGVAWSHVVIPAQGNPNGLHLDATHPGVKALLRRAA